MNIIESIKTNRIRSIAFIAFIPLIYFFYDKFLSFEKLFTDHKEFLTFIITIVSLAIVIIGWFVNSSKTRNLQRKQLAISVLNDNRYEQVWVDATHTIFEKIRDPSYTEKDWETLGVNAFKDENSLNDEDSVLWKDLRTVINTFEFVAMAINNKAIDEYVVKESWCHFYYMMYVALRGLIREGREIAKEPNMYINFTSVTEKWRPEIATKKGTPATEK